MPDRGLETDSGPQKQSSQRCSLAGSWAGFFQLWEWAFLLRNLGPSTDQITQVRKLSGQGDLPHAQKMSSSPNPICRKICLDQQCENTTKSRVLSWIQFENVGISSSVLCLWVSLIHLSREFWNVTKISKTFGPNLPELLADITSWLTACALTWKRIRNH